MCLGFDTVDWCLGRLKDGELFLNARMSEVVLDEVAMVDIEAVWNEHGVEIDGCMRQPIAAVRSAISVRSILKHFVS